MAVYKFGDVFSRLSAVLYFVFRKTQMMKDVETLSLCVIVGIRTMTRLWTAFNLNIVITCKMLHTRYISENCNLCIRLTAFIIL